MLLVQLQLLLGETGWEERNMSVSNAPINVMPHLPPPEPGGDKGKDLTDNSDPTHGAFDLSVYYTPQYSYSI